MRTPPVEEFEAVANSAAPGVFVPIGGEGMITTREDARLIALALRMRAAPLSEMAVAQEARLREGER